MRLTELAHEHVAAVLRPGDLAADATAGNGHDTLFLARAVGETGRVFAFDIQPEALAATRARLEKHGVAGRCEMIPDCHSAFVSRLPEQAHGALGAVMANLGYLPGGREAIVTTADGTLRMLSQAAANLRPGGILSVIAYPGHPGGDVEAAAVAAKLHELEGEGFVADYRGTPGDAGRRPWLALLRRPRV